MPVLYISSSAALRMFCLIYDIEVMCLVHPHLNQTQGVVTSYFLIVILKDVIIQMYLKYGILNLCH